MRSESDKYINFKSVIEKLKPIFIEILNKSQESLDESIKNAKINGSSFHHSQCLNELIKRLGINNSFDAEFNHGYCFSGVMFYCSALTFLDNCCNSDICMYSKTDHSFEFIIKVSELCPPLNSYLKRTFYFLNMENKNQLIHEIGSIFSDYELLIKSGKYSLPLISVILPTLYEDIFQLLDPDRKKELNAIYTPQSVSRFIYSGVQHLLTEKFKITDGLVNSDLIYLDPAAGSLTFACQLIESVTLIFQNPTDSHHEALKDLINDPMRISSYFKDLFENRFIALEIQPIALIIGILNIHFLLCKHSYELKDSLKCSGAYIANALEEDISKINKSRKIKNPLIFIGNPPYNLESTNKSLWIHQLIEDYKKYVQKKGSKKIKLLRALHDDYIKFIRLGQWFISDNNREGIVALITNNSFLTYRTTRGMRNSLLNAFDEIWVVDLHGDLRRGIPKEKQDVGINHDENIFNIKQGVCISFFIKNTENRANKRLARVYYADIWGTNTQKNQFLHQNFKDIPFKHVRLNDDWQFVIQNNISYIDKNKYDKFYYLPDLFRENIQGIVTGHDSLVSHVDRDILKENLRKFFDGSYEKLEVKKENKIILKENGIYYNANARDWKAEIARSGTFEESCDSIISWQWRGFDRRYLCYTSTMLNSGTNRWKLMQYMLPHQNNIALVVNRQSIGSSADKWSSVFITDVVIDNKSNEGSKGFHSYLFPLKIGLPIKTDYFNKPEPAIDSNLNPMLRENIEYLQNIDDEIIFSYIYGILHSTIFRTKYRCWLNEDFPRIPFPSRVEDFLSISDSGKELINLHLCRNSNVNKIIYPCNDNAQKTIIRPFYDSKENTIFFDSYVDKNKNDIFWIGNITPKIWNYEIGGIKQIKHWLNSRKIGKSSKNALRRSLNDLEFESLLRMIYAIDRTLEIIPKLDSIFERIENQFL